MADGIFCEHCGWYETDHVEYIPILEDDNKEEIAADIAKVYKGRKYSLNTCPQYTPEDKKLAKRLQEEHENPNGISPDKPFYYYGSTD